MKMNLPESQVHFAGRACRCCCCDLFAPKSGAETRKDISRQRKIKRNAVDLVEDTIESVNDFTSDIKEKASDIIRHEISETKEGDTHNT